MKCTKLGYFTDDTIDFPPLERLEKRFVAVAECGQEIPCNPCVDACPVGAITIGENINHIPHIDFQRCTGCGICLGVCPGLSIFMAHRKGDTGWVTLPYELFPPDEGEEVDLLDRQGKKVGRGVVEKIRRLKQHDRTLLITLRMAADLIHAVRGFRRSA